MTLFSCSAQKSQRRTFSWTQREAQEVQEPGAALCGAIHSFTKNHSHELQTGVYLSDMVVLTPTKFRTTLFTGKS